MLIWVWCNSLKALELTPFLDQLIVISSWCFIESKTTERSKIRRVTPKHASSIMFLSNSDAFVFIRKNASQTSQLVLLAYIFIKKTQKEKIVNMYISHCEAFVIMTNYFFSSSSFVKMLFWLFGKEKKKKKTCET